MSNDALHPLVLYQSELISKFVLFNYFINFS